MATFFKLISLLCLIYCANAQVQGLWYWTWSSGVNVGSTNLGVAFSGWVDPDEAISNSASTLGSLPGTKYISLGGGNSNGAWTSAVLQKVSSYCSSRKFSGYSGIAFDIEEGDAGLSSAFLSAFSACKSGGYQVLVTTSHSQPYGISDGQSLMQAFISSHNIDYLSPQLYTTGSETSNDYTADGTQWSQYASSSAKVVPSIVTGSLYPSAQSYFAGVGVKTYGYVQWSQTVTSGGGGGGSPVTPPSSGGSTVRCGTSWTSANSGCGKTCSTNGDCPSGQYCYNALNPCGSSSPPPPPPPPPPSSPPSSGGSTVRCGSSWTSANSGCGKTCTTDGDCPSGQYCYNALNPCKGGSSASSTRCGSSWTSANSQCGASCTTNADCSGSSCWASLSLSPCGSNAVAENSNFFSETTPVSGTLSPLTIGLIVGACVLLVAIIVVVVLLVISKKGIIEERV